MLGSAAEAEDVVQDAWLRWQSTDRSVVEQPVAFLTTTTTRLALNVATSARARRETYVGPWLPEPIDTTADPSLGAQQAEALDLAVLQLLEKLTPTERAAYVLREAFDYSFAQIAEVLAVREDHARQLAARARKHLNDERRAPVADAERERLLHAFIAAAQLGDQAALERILAADAASYTDGAGATGAARIPVLGGPRIAKFVASFKTHFWVGTTVRWRRANGAPAALIERDGVLVAFASIDASANGIERVLWIMSPSKLEAFAKA